MFILGTANFGNVYQGSKQVIETQGAHNLVQEFTKLGGYQLDTADAYGDATHILQGLNDLNFNVGTKIESKKLLSLDAIIDCLSNIERQFEEKTNYILLHDSQFLREVQNEPIDFCKNIQAREI